MAEFRATEEHHSVVIIGGGLAGLYAARLLLPKFPDLLLVEACDALGGRIKQVEGVAEWPIEAGPEFVHGGNALLKGLLEEMGCTLRKLEWPDHWWWGKERRLAVPGAQDAELDWLEDKFGSIGETVAPPTPDVSAETWLRLQGASPRALAAADACWANDFGCGLAELGVRELIAENKAWDAGESYMLLDRSLRELITHLAAPLAGRVRCGWPVSLVDWRPCSSSGRPGSSGISSGGRSGVVLHGPGGQTLHCDRVLVTVPLRMLQTGGIRFQPQLLPRKQAAIGRLRMGTAVKILLAFSHPVWPDGFWDAVCPGGFLPELWVTSYPAQRHPPVTRVRQSPQHSGGGSSGSGGVGSEMHGSDAQQRGGGGADTQVAWSSDARQPIAVSVTAAELAAAQRSDGTQSGSDFDSSGSSSFSSGYSGSGVGIDSASISSRADRQGQPPAEAAPSRHAVTGFACGPAAAAIAALPPALAVQRALAQLDDMFETQQQPRPASKAFVTASVVDWSRQPYIGGAYTYPTLGAEPGDREALGAPVDGALFFAGEAAHPAVNPCMQAALETGQTAAAQIAAAVSCPRSAL